MWMVYVIEVDFEFQGKTMKTPVYMDAPDKLLLSKVVC